MDPNVSQHTPLPHPAAKWDATAAAIPHESVISQITYWVGMVAILGVALFLRTWNLEITDAWSDELHTLRRVEWSLPDALDSILTASNQTPLYYMLLRLLPGDSIMWLRLPSIVFGLISIVLLSECVVHIYHNRTLGLTLGALLAVHPMHVILSRTARFYTILLVLALIETFCFMLLLRDRRGRTLWAVFWISSALGYAMHYTALALPATQFLFLLLVRRKERPLLKRWMLVQITAAIPLMLWYVVLLIYWFTPLIPGPEKYHYPYLGQTVFFSDLPVSVFNVLLGYDGRWTWLLLPGLIAGAAGLVAGVVDALVDWRRDQARAYLAVLVLVTFLTLFALGTVFGAQYRDRYYAVIMPAVIILFALGLKRWSLPLEQLIIFAVVLCSAGITVTLFQGGHYQRTAWSQVGVYLNDYVEPGDAVVFERDLHVESFVEHYTGDPVLLDQITILETARTNEAIADSIKVEPDAARLWVVYRVRHEDKHSQEWEYANPLTPQLSCTSNWLIQRADRIREVKKFNGVYVYLVDGLGE